MEPENTPMIPDVWEELSGNKMIKMNKQVYVYTWRTKASYYCSIVSYGAVSLYLYPIT